MTEQRLTLTVNEAAALLGVSRPTVYTLMRQGRLTQIKLGRRTFIGRKQVVALVDGAAPAEQDTSPVLEYTRGRKRSGAR
jgi:excisionase family DNA binding protein